MGGTCVKGQSWAEEALSVPVPHPGGSPWLWDPHLFPPELLCWWNFL